MFISYKELSASSRVKRQGRHRTHADIGYRRDRKSLFRWTALLLCIDKGWCHNRYNSNESSRTETNGLGLVPRLFEFIHHPSSSYFLYFTDRRYHTGISMTTRHRKTATQQQQPQATSTATSSNRRLSAERNCIVITSSEQGWNPIEMEQ